VLLGSLASLILSAILVPLRARHHRKLAA
jgi:hypothetical protein